MNPVTTGTGGGGGAAVKTIITNKTKLGSLLKIELLLKSN